MSVKITKTSDGIKFSVRVVPKSSRNNISALDENSFKLKITAPPVDGKANEACENFVSDILSVAKSKVKIVSGQKSKSKIIEVKGDPNELCKKLLGAIEPE